MADEKGMGTIASSILDQATPDWSAGAQSFIDRMKGMEKIRDAILSRLVRGENGKGDYGQIVARNGKAQTGDFLFETGAEKIARGFNLRVQFGRPQIVTEHPFTVECQCQLVSLDSGAVIAESPWKRCSMEEKTFAQRALSRRKLEELRDELMLATAEKDWPHLRAALASKAGYGQKYGKIKYVIYALRDLADVTTAREVVEAALDSADTLDAIKGAVVDRAQKRAFVKATRAYSCVGALLKDPDEPLAQDEDETPAPAKPEATKPGSTPAPVPARPPSSAPLTGVASSDQWEAIIALAPKTGKQPNDLIRSLGINEPGKLTAEQAAAVIAHLQRPK